MTQPTLPRKIFRKLLMAGLLIMISAGFFSVSPLMAENPYALSDNSWITINGTVLRVAPDAFDINYGQGHITVEMDDGDRDADGYKLLPGDKVTVTGKIDDNFFEKTTIEASTVYLDKQGTTFFASALDEEALPFVDGLSASVFTISLYGPVTAVGEKEFTLGRKEHGLRVDVTQMPSNPLDDEGYQKIQSGDYVRVTGTMVDDIPKNRKLLAISITEFFK